MTAWTHSKTVVVTLEIWRGDTLRDRVTHEVVVVAGKPWNAAYRLRWTDRPEASSRLSYHILLDDWEIARCGLLLGSSQIDPQGRFAPEADRPASAATLLAYEDELQNRLGVRRSP